jgi:ketosteroid isomerase-like protein
VNPRILAGVATENEELAKRGFDALASGGVEAMLEFVHPDFEMETLPGIAAEPQTYRGHDGVRRWFDSFYEVMDEITVAPTSYRELQDGRVLLGIMLRARGQTSGIEVEQDARSIATLRDGLLIRLDFLLPGDPDPV